MTMMKIKNLPSQGNFNNLLDTFFSPVPSLFKDDFATPAFNYSVPVNISETENSYRLEIVAPGFAKEDFKIDLEKNTLTVAVEKKSEEEVKESKQLRKEYKYQSFKRSFTVDEVINADEISAEYVNGVLTLNLPKKEEVKPQIKQITIS